MSFVFKFYMGFNGYRSRKVGEFMILYHLNGGSDIIPKVNILVYMGNCLSVYDSWHGINEGTRFKRLSEIETLGRTKQLNAEDLFKIAGNLKCLTGTDGSHAHMILLAEGCGNTIGTGRETQGFILTYKRSRRILRYHKTGIKSGFLHQKLWQSFDCIHQGKIYPAIGNIPDFCGGQGGIIEWKCKHLAMEIATADGFIPARAVAETIGMHDRFVRGNAIIARRGSGQPAHADLRERGHQHVGAPQQDAVEQARGFLRRPLGGQRAREPRPARAERRFGKREERRLSRLSVSAPCAPRRARGEAGARAEGGSVREWIRSHCATLPPH